MSIFYTQRPSHLRLNFSVSSFSALYQMRNRLAVARVRSASQGAQEVNRSRRR